MYKDAVSIFKVLSDENRLKILHYLKNSELCACNLEERLNLSQSGLSYHMKLLVDAGLVIKRPEGNWVHYRINEDNRDIIDLVELIINK